jgi:hypothetical protein
MTHAYKTTEVPVARSQEAIRKLLIDFGARGVQFYEDFESHQINVRFAKEVNKQLRTVSVTMTVPKPAETVRKRAVRYVRGKMVYGKTASQKQEQNTKATYRALHYWLKSQFEAVEYGLFSFEDVFLSHFEWILNGQTTTVGALVKPRLEGNLLSAGSPLDNSNEEVIEG